MAVRPLYPLISLSLPTVVDHRFFLPSYNSDHNHRWFVIGSIGFMLTSALTLANSYDSHELLGQDDSTLTLEDYRATWWLMTISGIFLIFGRFLSCRVWRLWPFAEATLYTLLACIHFYQHVMKCTA
jgi:hypothetical protein